MQTSLPPPIPDPHETQSRRVKKRGKTFRARFIPILLGMLVFSLLVWYVLIWPAVSVGPSSASVAKNVADTLMILLLSGFCGAVVTYFLLSVRVAEDSISGKNAWGIPTEVTWDEIAEARRINFCGLKYLVVV